MSLASLWRKRVEKQKAASLKPVRACLQLAQPSPASRLPRLGSPAVSVPSSSSSTMTSTSVSVVGTSSGSNLWTGTAPWGSGFGTDDRVHIEEEELAVLQRYVGSAVRPSTVKSYSVYWNKFRAFCDQ